MATAWVKLRNGLMGIVARVRWDNLSSALLQFRPGLARYHLELSQSRARRMQPRPRPPRLSCARKSPLLKP
jgi:hypothetical protein